MADIFGQYESDTNNFRFTSDERALIIRIKNHACDAIELDEVQQAFGECKLENESQGNNKKNDAIESWINAIKTDPPQTLTHLILKKLLETADQNSLREKGGYRYSDSIKQFAVYFRIIAGPTAYETVQRNLNCALPSLNTINRYIHKSSRCLCEGVLRSSELLKYLQDRNLPMVVSLSEDATQIDGRVQFDPHNNQLIGFVLPIDETTGMPTPFVYRARSVEEIVLHFSTATTSKFVNTIMAQPMANVPAFCLMIFGSDNRFNAMDVANRWLYITNELQKLNIIVINISSDSDPKYNCAMRKNSFLGNKSNEYTNVNWFSCGNNIERPFYSQDSTHIGTKLRSLFLKTIENLLKLPMGDYYIQVHHLEKLIKIVSKDVHRLTATTINPKDKMNFESVLKICDNRIIDLLKKHVKGSDGTIMYLQIMKHFIDSFMDSTLEPLERVDKIWYALFVVRIWRQNILETESLSLKLNFMSANCYACLEQNAHSMILILLYLKRTNSPNLFMPWIYGSQPCENYFRLIRSLSSTFSMVANCSVKEMLERMNKIQLLSDISNDSTTEFVFLKRMRQTYAPKTVEIQLPTFDEILATIEKSKSNAIKDCITIGLLTKEEEKHVELPCQIKPYDTQKVKHIKQTTSVSNTAYIVNYAHMISQLKHVSLKNYSQKFLDQKVPETSSYVEIFGARKRIVIKKSSLVWLLRSDSIKLSSDRLRRVMVQTDKCTKKKSGIVKKIKTLKTNSKFKIKQKKKQK